MSSILDTSDELVGDVYLAETDTLTAGVPQTNSKIHSFIKFYGAPRNRSVNFSRDGRFTVPANHVIMPLPVDFSSGRNVDAIITNEIRLSPDAPWFTLGEFHSFQQFSEKNVFGLFPLQEKTEVRFVATSLNDNADVTFSSQAWLVNLNEVEF
jgi:hypothetical protein